MFAILQKLSEIIALSTEDNAKPLMEVYNAIVASIITPCAFLTLDNAQCGNRSVKLACFKSRAQTFILTAYIGVCADHLTSLVEIPDHLDISLTRFVIGDKIQCKATPYSDSLDGIQEKASG